MYSPVEGHSKIANLKQRNHCDEYIENIRRILPDACTTKDLIRAGIYHSAQSAANERRAGKGPSHFKLKNRAVFYPKSAVIDYLQQAKRVGSV
jgi:predicted DNA-binding transcriptional regulator AlpA